MRHNSMLPILAKLSVLWIVFIVSIGASEAAESVESLGCKSVSLTNSRRAFRANPGAIGGSGTPTAVSPETCRQQCSDVPARFNYAGVHASLCFCGYNLPSANVTGCVETCGPTTQECESVTWNSQMMLYSIVPTEIVPTKMDLSVSDAPTGPNSEQAVQDIMAASIGSDVSGVFGRIVDQDPFLATGAATGSVLLEQPVPANFSGILARPTFSGEPVSTHAY
uniref:WSC domain-containing protein n=1 Tax=Macrostomum lignano TaxID=282301 RepID=A0A1I8FWA6_9PLAT